MNISEIFSDSFKYPVSDIKKFAIFGIVVVLATLNVSIANSSVLQIILNVVSFVAIILILGYGLDVVKYAFKKSDELPDFDFKTGFVNGLKLFVIIAIIIFMYEECKELRKELNEYEYIRYTDAHRT